MSKIIQGAHKHLNQESPTLAKKTHLTLSIILLSVGLSTLSSSAWANSVASETADLNAIIAKVQNYQGSQDVWKSQEKIAELNLKNARLWDNPSLTIEKTGFDANKDQELSFTLSQRLDVFGERKAQKQIAQLSQQQISLKQQVYLTKLKLVVKHTWSQLAILSVEQNLIQDQLKLSQENLNIAQNRYLAGSIAQVDVDRIRMLYLENQRLANQSQLQLNLAQKQLSQLWGQEKYNVDIAKTAKNLWPKNVEYGVKQNLSNNIFQKSLQMDVGLAQANLEYLKAKARPNPSLSLGMNRTKSSDNARNSEVMFGIEIPLNIFNRNQYNVQIVQAQQNALSRQEAVYEQQNQRLVQNLLDEISGLEQQFNQLEQHQFPLANQIQQRMLVGFRAGKFNISDVQQATQQIQEIRMRKVQLLKDGWQRAIDVESLSVGIDSSEITAKDALSSINQSIWSEIQTLPVIGGGN